MGELGLSSEQGERFRGQLRRILCDPISEIEARRLELAVAYMTRLRSTVAFVASEAQAQLEGVRAILTPAQLIRFLAWTSRNAVSISAALGSAATTGVS